MGWNAPWPLGAGANLQVVANGPQPDLFDALAERDFVFEALGGSLAPSPSYFSTWADGVVGGQILDASFWYSVHVLFDDEYSVWIDEHTTFPRDSTQWNFTPANLCAAVGVPIADTIGLDTFGAAATGVSGNLLFMGWLRRYRSISTFDPRTSLGPYQRKVTQFQLVMPADNNIIQNGEKFYDETTYYVWQYHGGTSFTNLGPWTGTVQPDMITDHGSFSSGTWFWFPDHGGGGSEFIIQFVADWNLLKTAYHHLRWLEGTASVDTADPSYITNDSGGAISGTSQAIAESNAQTDWDLNFGTAGAYSGTIYAVAGNYHDAVNTPTIWQTHYGGNYGRVKGTGSDPYFSIDVDVYVYPQKCIADEGLDNSGNVLDAYNFYDDNGAGLTMNVWNLKGTAGPAVSVTAYTPYMGKAAIGDYPNDAPAGPYVPSPGGTSTNNGFMISTASFNYDLTSDVNVAAIIKYDVVGGFTKP